MSCLIELKISNLALNNYFRGSKTPNYFTDHPILHTLILFVVRYKYQIILIVMEQL